jgi:hypothetical protein
MEETLRWFMTSPIMMLGLYLMGLMGLNILVIRLFLDRVHSHREHVLTDTNRASIEMRCAYLCPTCMVVHQGQQCPRCDGAVSEAIYSLWRAGHGCQDGTPAKNPTGCRMLRKGTLSDIRQGVKGDGGVAEKAVLSA